MLMGSVETTRVHAEPTPMVSVPAFRLLDDGLMK